MTTTKCIDYYKRCFMYTLNAVTSIKKSFKPGIPAQYADTTCSYHITYRVITEQDSAREPDGPGYKTTV